MHKDFKEKRQTETLPKEKTNLLMKKQCASASYSSNSLHKHKKSTKNPYREFHTQPLPFLFPSISSANTQRTHKGETITKTHENPILLHRSLLQNGIPMILRASSSHSHGASLLNTVEITNTHSSRSPKHRSSAFVEPSLAQQTQQTKVPTGRQCRLVTRSIYHSNLTPHTKTSHDILVTKDEPLRRRHGSLPTPTTTLNHATPRRSPSTSRLAHCRGLLHRQDFTPPNHLQTITTYCRFAT